VLQLQLRLHPHRIVSAFPAHFELELPPAMPSHSHLTPVVFRSIVANTPLLYRGCLHRAPRPRIALENGARTLLPTQRRAFFNFLKPQRKVKDAQMPPGLEKLGELVHMQQVAARPPPPSHVAAAFNVFVSQRDIVFEDFHVNVAHNAYRYLQENPRDDAHPWLSVADIRTALAALTRPPKTGGREHLAFARVLFAELDARQAKQENDGQEPPAASDKHHAQDKVHHVQLLTLYGSSLEARDMAVKVFSGNMSPEIGRQADWAWAIVLKGFAREDNEEELLRTVTVMRQVSQPLTPRMQQQLVAYFARKSNLEQAKYFYQQPTFDQQRKPAPPRASTYAAILKACALGGDLSFGQQVVASLLTQTPNKDAWDAIFLWSAAIGKGVDEVDRMMNVMIRRTAESPQQETHPDIDTINALVEFSIAKQDPYSAERYITLGEKRGILPNEKTFTMQMQYRLSVKDVDGAKAAYFGLQGSLTNDENSINAINQLIQALCDLKHHQFDEIMAIVDDLHERKAKLMPETVAALCVLHLRRGEAIDAMDLLQVHAFSYSPAQRTMIHEQLVKFLLDGQHSTADAWDTYQILRQVFPETSRADRIRIMNEFFARHRSDMACHVFFHMRNHETPGIAANKDVYTAAFTGFARNADAESLELVHNQLRLDLGVEMDTKVRNSLMLAYAATGNNKRALEIWSEIVGSEEGPTYNSIAIAFRSCEGMPFGDQHAKPIWQRLKQMDVEIDKQIFTAYLGAIARNQLHDEAVAMLETVEEEYGFTPDLYMCVTCFSLHNHVSLNHSTC
jgi:hypothetical protein